MREIDGESGSQDLVIHDAEWGARRRSFEHRLDEVAAFAAASSHPVKTAGANDKVSIKYCGHKMLSRQFRGAIDAQRMGQINFRKRFLLFAIKDVIRAEVNQNATGPIARLGQVP